MEFLVWFSIVSTIFVEDGLGISLRPLCGALSNKQQILKPCQVLTLEDEVDLVFFIMVRESPKSYNRISAGINEATAHIVSEVPVHVKRFRFDVA